MPEPPDRPPDFAPESLTPLGPPATTTTTTTTTGDAPPPTYSVSQPQILIAPLPDSPSFFWGRTIQGEVFVKGLGGRSDRARVKALTVQLHLDDILPGQPTISIIEFPTSTLYPPGSTSSTQSQSQSTSSPADHPFPSIHRFSIPLPKFQLLPGTLNLRSSDRGQVKWSLVVSLTLASGAVVNETVPVDGTPQEIDLSCEIVPDAEQSQLQRPDSIPREVEEVLEKSGVRCRMLLDNASPRLGDLLRLGVEIHPMGRQKTGVAGLSSQPNPSETLRPLRRVRVELFRKVVLHPLHSDEPSSSSTPPKETVHLMLLYASGKSLRYPGTASVHPPLRVLFTIPTTQSSNVADQTWGEIAQFTPYHSVKFFVRVTIGFGGVDLSPTIDGSWILERELEVLPKLWKEPRQVVVQGGEVPALGEGDRDALTNDEELRKEAYRTKGRDVVGASGTIRQDGPAFTPGFAQGGDLPPPFDGAGPSGTTPDGPVEPDSGLPTFLESEAQMRTGEAPLPNDLVRSERLVPVNFEADGVIPPPREGPPPGGDRTNWVGRRGSLGGELGTWVEYDGYETFSVAPPSVSASFGVGGVMDPPQEGDEDVNVVGGMMGRLGLDGEGPTGRELIEQLGLGEGSRVVDLQDDLPPGIDEPSLPALPNFHNPNLSPTGHSVSAGGRQPHGHGIGHGHGQPPPSFAASEAAAAVAAVNAVGVGGARRASRSQSMTHPPSPPPHPYSAAGPPPPPAVQETHDSIQAQEGEDAPPGYFGGAAGGGTQGGPPAYS